MMIVIVPVLILIAIVLIAVIGLVKMIQASHELWRDE